MKKILNILLIFSFIFFNLVTNIQAVGCGEIIPMNNKCNCDGAGAVRMSNGQFCCGIVENNQCIDPAKAKADVADDNVADDEVADDAAAKANADDADLEGSEHALTGAATEEVTSDTFDALNPLKVAGVGKMVDGRDLSTPGGIISRILDFAFPIAGFILLVMLVWSGFEMLSGAADQKSLEAGRQRATAALIGFVLLFVSYWMIQIVYIVFGIKDNLFGIG